jgi:hypothetical protein
MISCHLHHLASRCRERGYTLDEVRACIVSQDGNKVTVDVDHPSYPRNPKPDFLSPPMPPPRDPGQNGPGGQLKALLSRIGIVATPNCSCNKRARIMDEKGCDWCEAHIDEIDGWLAEEAKTRKLPYLSLAGRLLISLAIRRARKRDNKS